MKKLSFSVLFVLATVCLFAQKKTTTSATIAFDASTSLDAMPKAENKTAIGSLDTKTGALAFEATVKNFAFSNPKMQEHFNGEKWMDSDKFATFVFKGKIASPSAVNFKKDGTYPVNVEGMLTVKGVEKPVKTPATIVVSGGNISTSAMFTILLDDYGITGAPISAGKVSKEPKISVSADFK